MDLRVVDDMGTCTHPGLVVRKPLPELGGFFGCGVNQPLLEWAQWAPTKVSYGFMGPQPRFHGAHLFDSSRNADVLPSERHAFKWLTEHGWTKVGNRAWRHSGIRSLVSADPHWDSKVKDCQAHQLRESWRYCQWQHLCQGKRHQATEHRLEPYSEARCQMLRQITQTSSGPRRWLLLGAARSPMQIAKQRRTHVAPCIHHNCSVQEAGWHHIFWQCPARPAHLNVTGPHSGLLLRYGWLRTKDDEALLSHMEEEVTKIWQCCSCNAAADAADLRIDRCS